MNIMNAMKEKYTLIHDQEYLNWLEEFVSRNGHLDTDRKWIRERAETLSEEDIKNIKRFSDFYKEICAYADEVYIYMVKEDFGMYYVVRIKDNYYRIGVIVDEIAYCFIEKVKDAGKYDHVLDITDLSKINYRAAEIERNLEEIVNYIDTKVVCSEVPLKAILERINKYVYSFHNK